jgi:hypothetical protein
MGLSEIFGLLRTAESKRVTSVQPLHGLRVAICYWGLTRSTRLHYRTHAKHLSKPLLLAGAEIKTYIHVWEPSSEEGRVCGARARSRQEAYLLQPDSFLIEDQQPFLRSIDFSDYFRRDLYEKHGDSEYEWHPHMVRNHLCALESLRRVYAMASSDESGHDFVLFVRPDMELRGHFPVESVRQCGPEDILICDNSHHEGYNDRFAGTWFARGAHYANRIAGLADYRRKVGRIVSEKYVRHIVDLHFASPFFISFPMRRMRADGRKLQN